MNQTPDKPTTSDRAGRDLATWHLRPGPAWLVALVVSVGGVLLTAFGAAFAQVRGLDEIASVYLLAGFVAASAVIGLVVLLLTRRPLAHYGFRGPKQLPQIWWAIPIFVIPVVVLITTPPNVPAAAYPAYALAR